MAVTVFRLVVGLLIGVVVICSLVISAIVGVAGQDQGPDDVWDCMYYIDSDDPDGSESACSGTIAVGVISLFFGIAVIVTLFFTNVQLGLFSFICSIIWTIIWVILASYITAGWNKTCDTFSDCKGCDCEATCDFYDVDYDALNSTIAMAWITAACWLISSFFLWLVRKD
eukprot:TRINITY_DN716_c0_g1_i4.p1 TRINITY_DN716_c0_g1~~TRINITY_DN716_c0_g1_i4.p1  ORF type:complete len:192 (+),score=38.88 TRINITY_DN716_c0_g1_i4:67-576(+)